MLPCNLLPPYISIIHFFFKFRSYLQEIEQTGGGFGLFLEAPCNHEKQCSSYVPDCKFVSFPNFEIGEASFEHLQHTCKVKIVLIVCNLVAL